MAQATNLSTTSRQQNLSNEMLADAIGNADLAVKAAEKTLADYKDELKRRGLASATGEHFSVTVTPQISTRLDTKALRAFLGADAAQFETSSITQVIRVRPTAAFASAA
jgi:hypothetical protein